MAKAKSHSARQARTGWLPFYGFFLVHMLGFGASGFFMAYKAEPAPIVALYLHGGFAVVVYLIFYVGIFGREEVKWMMINAALGLWGITGEMDWLLSLFGKELSSYPFYVHVIPFLYYVLYTFLLRRAVLHLAGVQDDESKAQIVNYCYVAVSLILYSAIHLL